MDGHGLARRGGDACVSRRRSASARHAPLAAPWCDEASVAHWTQDGAELPTTAEAFAGLREMGRTSEGASSLGATGGRSHRREWTAETGRCATADGLVERAVMMVTMAGWRLEHTYAELPQLFYSHAAPTAVREPRLVAFNRPLATMLGLEPEALERSRRRRDFRRQCPARRRATDRAGVRRPPVRPLHRPRRWPCDPARRADHAVRRSPGHSTERGRADAVLPPRRRARRARADAAGIHHQRGDARARHSDHPEPGRGDDGRAGVSRDGAPGRSAHARCREPYPRRHHAVGSGARRRRSAMRALADYTRARHYPELADSPEPYIALFDAILARQASPDCPLAAGRLHPRRDEHRQHGPLRRNDRLRPVRVHGQRTIPPRCSAPSTTAGDTRTATSRRSRSGTSHDLPKRCCRCSIGTSIARWSGPRRRSTAFRTCSSSTGWTACERSLDCSRRKMDDEALVDDLLAWMQRRSADFTNTFRSLTSGRPVGRLHERRSRIGGLASPVGGAPRAAAAVARRGRSADAAAQPGVHPAQSQRGGGAPGRDQQRTTFP